MSKNPNKHLNNPRKISDQEAVDEFVALHPAFAKCWSDSKDSLGDLATRMIYVEFANAMGDILRENPREDFGPTMRLAEKIIRDGNNKAEYSVCVWFIESLLAQSDKHPKLMEPVLKQMGPLSREHALAYNKLMGSSNPGLER